MDSFASTVLADLLAYLAHLEREVEQAQWLLRRSAGYVVNPGHDRSKSMLRAQIALFLGEDPDRFGLHDDEPEDLEQQFQIPLPMEMTTCPHCGFGYAYDISLCPRCGQPPRPEGGVREPRSPLQPAPGGTMAAEEPVLV